MNAMQRLERSIAVMHWVLARLKAGLTSRMEKSIVTISTHYTLSASIVGTKSVELIHRHEN